MNDFFIIASKEISPRIFRLSLDKEAQNLLIEIFSECYNDFNIQKNNSEIINYYAGYELAKNELFKIENFDNKLNIKDVFDNPTGVANVDFSRIKLVDIDAVFTIKSDTKECLIQYINSRNILDLSRTIIKKIALDECTLTVPKDDGISLAKNLTGIIDLTDNSLIFNSFHVIGRIFDMKEYFKEITDQMLVDFVDNYFEVGDNNFNILDIANDKMRNSAAKIINLKILEDLDLNALSEKANNIEIDCCAVNDAKTKLILPNKTKEINELFSFLNSLIFRSAITGERMKASSARPY